MTGERRPDPRWRIGYLLAGVAMFALGSSVAASSVLTDYPIAYGQALRYGLAAGILALVAGRRLRRPRWREALGLLLLAALGLVGFNQFLIAALQVADAGSVGVIVGGVPLVLAIIGPLTVGLRPGRRVIAAAAIVVLGAALVQGTAPAVSVAGALLAAGALACEVAFTLLAVPLLARLRPIGVATYACVAAIPMALILSFVLDEGFGQLPTPLELGALAYLAVVVTAAGFVAWYVAVERVGSAQAGLFVGIVPVAALLTSAFLGTAVLDPVRLIGAMAVGAGVVVGISQRASPPGRG